MVGNHVDCRVLQRLTAEQLPEVHNQLVELDVGIQLITTRWFLCLWSSVLPPTALYRVWDFLFACGPTAVMQAALGCMHIVAPAVLEATDIGSVLAAVKDELQAAGDGSTLMQLVLYRLGDISEPQLVARRRLCRQQVTEDTRHMHATRRMVKLQRSSGFAQQELSMIARLCGEQQATDAMEAAGAVLAISLDFATFVTVVRQLVPQWHNESELLDRLFAVFCGLSREGKFGQPDETDCRDRSLSSQLLASDFNRLTPPLDQELLDQRLNFEQMVHGCGWLLRGTSKRRSELCFRCFDLDGAGHVSKGHFHSLLLGLYAMYEPEKLLPLQDARAMQDARVIRIKEEAGHFVDMM